jgi:tripartite-type tricarboxylate transporter receptor subunit TctC
MSGVSLSRPGALALFCAAVLAAWLAPPGLPKAAAAGWEPGRPVRLIVPAERGGEADVMARALQTTIARERLLAHPLEVVNRPGEGGAEGFDEVQAARGDPHVLVLGVSNLFTAPPAAGSIGWRDMTPVAMLALEPVALWVHAASAHRGARDLAAAAMAGEVRVGAAGGAGQEAGEMVVSAMGRATGAGFTFAPVAGGGAGAARAVAGRRVDAAVAGLGEALAEWEAGRVRPLCVFGRGGATPGGAAAAAEIWGWGGVPDCRDDGLEVEYVAHRGVLLPAAVAPEQRAFFEDLLRRVRESPAWREVLDGGLLESAAAPDAEAYARWLAAEELRHEEWLYAGGVFARR